MKKVLTSLAVCLSALCFFSCSAKESELDSEIIGTWTNELSGYRFGENNKISLIIDFSKNAHFTSNGEFQTMNALITKENIDYDGSKVYITQTNYSDEYKQDLTSVLIDMERIDEPNPDSLDGRYHILGGVATDVLAENMGIPPEKFYFEGKVEGEKFIIYMIDCFDFTTNDGNINMFGDLLTEYITGDSDGMIYDYSIDAGRLQMTMDGIEGVTPEVYFKVEE